MSHKCRGPSCYRTLKLRGQCPPCNRYKARKAHEKRMNRIFERLPKDKYWLNYSSPRHLWKFGLTPVIIAETLESPDEVEFQAWVKKTPTAFYKFYPNGSRETADLDDAKEGAWFRVVLSVKGTLHTAFRDHDTERLGGRAVWPTPNTKLNNPRWG